MFGSGCPSIRNPEVSVVPDPGTFPDCIAALLPPDRIAALAAALEESPVGLATVGLPDFHRLAEIRGENDGLRLLGQFGNEARTRFAELFPDCVPLFSQPIGIDETLLAFRLPPGDADGLPGRALSLRLCLDAAIGRLVGDCPSDAVRVRVGYARLNPATGENPEWLGLRLFRAFCDIRRAAARLAFPETPGLPREVVRTSPAALPNAATPLRALIQPAATVAPDALVRDVEAMLADRPPMSSVVVVRGETPAGLVMNYNLGRQLGTRYGFALFHRREIARLMDPNPLIADIGEPVEEVAKAATNRENAKIYDDIIATENGRLAGTISVRKMLDHLAEIQVNIAMGANPLTGLPGNVAIEQEINRRSANGIPCSLIYVDLDNFKIYNDVYGFENGDRMILLTARTIREAAERMGGETFVGHVGGDDFVVISEQKDAEPTAAAIAEKFEAAVPDLYREADRNRGWMFGTGRDGVDREFRLVSVSIGIVDCEFRTAFTMDELSHRVAEIKKYAKSIPGNAFVRDRRGPIGGSSDSVPIRADDSAPSGTSE